MDTKQAIQLSSKFRQSAAAVKLGRYLFDPNLQLKLNPNQIANILRQIGVPIPAEVNVGLQTAQLIMSGGALISSISTAKSIMQIGQASVSTINAAMGVLQAAGLLDANSIFCRTVQMGADGALVASSGGTNVLADISFVMDIVSAAVFPPDDRPQAHQMLQQMNIKAAKNWWSDRVKTQSSNRQNLIGKFQNKEISMFEFMGEMALESPDSFLNYFPEMKLFVPPVLMKQCYTSEKDANHGGFLFVGRQTERVRETFCFDYESINVDKRGMVSAFIRKYIYDPFSPYFMLYAMPKSYVQVYGYPEKSRVQNHADAIYPRMHPGHLACLSLLSNTFDRVEDDFDVVPILRTLRLTPSDFGEESLISESTTYSDYYLNQTVLKDATVSINGTGYYSESNAAFNKKEALGNYLINLARNADSLGDIETLQKIPEVYAILKEWAIMPYVSPELTKMIPNLYNVTDKSLAVDYRNIQNFLSVYSVIDFMEKDSYLQSGGIQDQLQSLKSIIPSKQFILDEFEKLQFLSTARFLNVEARSNVAGFFKTTLDKVEFKTKADGTAFVVPKGSK